MIPLQIADINLKISENEFETALQDFQDNYAYNDMTHECKQMRMQKSGQEMLQVVINNDHGSRFTIVAERDDVSGDITFKPVKVKSLNESFFITSYADPDDVAQAEDPGMFFKSFMYDLCKKHKGTFAYLDPSGDMSIVKNGSPVKASSVALTDVNGTIYYNSGRTTVDMDEDDGISKFKIKKFWKEWLNENPDIMEKVNQLQTPADKFNFMGKALIAKKLSGEIDFSEFQDVFIQICAYDMVTDKTVLNFYQILK